MVHTTIVAFVRLFVTGYVRATEPGISCHVGRKGWQPSGDFLQLNGGVLPLQG